MADDDDDSFGEFTVASNHQTTVNSSSQIPSTTGNNDWNDLNFFQNNTSDHDPKSPQPQTNWNKINGALPLSLFGGDDNEEEDNESDFKKSSFSGNTGFVSNNRDVNNLNDKSNSKLGIIDLIANLYGPKQQQQQQNNKAVDNGNELDSVRSKDPFSNSDPLSSVSSNTVAARNHVSDDEGGWEFIDAFSDSKLRQNEIDFNNKEHSEKTVSAPGVQGGSHGAADLFVVANNGFYVESNGNELSSDPVGENDDFDDTFGEFETAFTEQPSTKKEPSEKTVSSLGLQDASHGSIDLFASPNDGVFVESHVKDSGFDSKPFTNFQNGFTTDVQAQSKGTTNEGSSPPGESEDFDDTFGEFETSFTDQPSTNKESSKESLDPLGSHGVPRRPVDLFAFSNGVPGGSHMVNNGFDFSQSSVLQNGVASDPFSQTEWKETKDDSDLQSSGVGVGVGVDENFGKFSTTFPEAGGSKPEGSEASSKNYKEAVPLSIFGIEEQPEADSFLNLQLELFKSSTHGKHTRNQSSNLSINDILSDLYGQEEQITSANHEDNPDGNVDLRHSTGNEYSSHVDDDDNDGSWEFKVAFSQSKVENQKLSFEKKLINCKHYYSNVKDDLCVVARHHLHGLKKAQSATTIVGEDMEMAVPNKEFQEALKELRQNDIIATEIDVDDYSEGVASLNQYIETLQEPDFQVLESEYHISRRLSLAESDLRTAIDLINHFSAVLMALTLAPMGEPADYVSLWFKVISVCSQELKHGTWIWKQSVEKNVHSEILSESQGKQFIIALGEIYRSVVILGAAMKFYKPWILLSGGDLEEIYCLLKECHFLWSSSGLEEAIPAESLLESISHIRNLDELAIANEVLSHKESQCQLSLLSPGVVPEMKMVIWNGDKYFVALANLWGNLISPNPPKLSVHVG